MDLPVNPSAMINLLRAWFFAKDRSLVMAPDTFIEGDEITTPGNPVSGRRRLYAKDDCWYDLDSDGTETSLCEGGAWSLIAETTLTGSVASVTFSSIPSTFRSLVVLIQARSSRVSDNDNVLLRFNGDTGNNYDWGRGRFRGNGVIDSTAAVAQTSGRIAQIDGSTSDANNFSPIVLYILGYNKSDREQMTLSRDTQFRQVGAGVGVGDVFLTFHSLRWRNSSVITSTTLFPGIGPNFLSGSIFELYGIL